MNLRRVVKGTFIYWFIIGIWQSNDSIKLGLVKLRLTSVEGTREQMTKGDQFNGEQKLRQFSNEYKQDAVNFDYLSGKTGEEVAKELKIGNSTLSAWIHAAKDNDGIVEHRGSGNYSKADKENARLRGKLKDENIS